MGCAALAVREISPAYTSEGKEADGSREPREPSGPVQLNADADRLEALGDDIVELAAHLHAGRARFLALLAAFDARGGWKPGGHTSCAHWLSVRTGYDLRTARDYVRTARRLKGLPRTRAAMARGGLAYSQVRALSRVATAETEEDLLTLAEGCTVSTLERRVRAWRTGSRQGEATRERQLHRARRLHTATDEDGMLRLRALLPPEAWAILLRALEAATDALYRQQRPEDHLSEKGAGGSAEPRSARQRRIEASRRWADALVLICERALAVGFGDEAPLSGTRAERYLALVHVAEETLSGEDPEAGHGELEDGTRLAAESVRRLVCDGAVVRVRRDGGGGVLDVGRKRRTVPPALRRALEVRDRGCRFPGCGLRFTDAHHITHWARGGATSLENTLLLCRAHHRLVHEEGWTVRWWGHRAAFTDPRGRLHLDGGWAPPELPEDPVAELVQRNRRHGADPDSMTPTARWKRERDVPDGVWLAAHEAGLTAVEERRAGAGGPSP